MKEEYRYYKSEFEFSNMGNIRKNNEPYSPLKDTNYYYVVIDGKTERVHTIIGRLFPEICGEWHKYYHYHHINGNKLDNRAENIVCLSPTEHKKVHLKESGIKKGVKAYTKDCEFVGEWDSKIEASIETGIDYRHINDCYFHKNGRYTAGKLFWFPAELTDEYIKNEILKMKKEKNKGNRLPRIKKNNLLN